MNGSPIIVIAGPTACGKSEAALLLAERLGGEIVSVDSMQVYRGMDIGTAKPSAEERARAPHHLIDVADITGRFDAAQFAKHAQQAIADIQQRSRAAILCGGTGLYFRAFFEGVGTAPAGDPKLRAELERIPLKQLLDELRQHDPATWDKIDRRNPRRVIRAIEVIRKTGRPFSEQKNEWSALPVPNGFGLRRDAGDLHDRINRRVDAMFAQGLVEETQQLLQRGLSDNPTAMQALGYRQVIEHLRGDRSLKETIDLVKLRTRQFAKRQMTWFRGQMQLQWIDVRPTQPASGIADQIFQTIAATKK
jgi:tRNA dimethylallyltransferase